jgi:hypothetical protein
MLKFFNQRRKKGQSTLEYAILIIIILGALLSIQVYIKRGIQGRLKRATDDIGDQFSPGNTNGITKKTLFSESDDTFQTGVTQSTLKQKEVSNTFTDLSISNVEQEFWGKTQD